MAAIPEVPGASLLHLFLHFLNFKRVARHHQGRHTKEADHRAGEDEGRRRRTVGGGNRIHGRRRDDRLGIARFTAESRVDGPPERLANRDSVGFGKRRFRGRCDRPLAVGAADRLPSPMVVDLDGFGAGRALKANRHATDRIARRGPASIDAKRLRQ